MLFDIQLYMCSLTGLVLVDLLTLVSLHCGLPNQCASSMAILKKFFMKLKNPIQFYYYCTFCMEYQGLSIPQDKLCKNRCCLKDLRKKENYSYFLIIPTYVPSEGPNTKYVFLVIKDNYFVSILNSGMEVILINQVSNIKNDLPRIVVIGAIF